MCVASGSSCNVAVNDCGFLVACVAKKALLPWCSFMFFWKGAVVVLCRIATGNTGCGPLGGAGV